MLKNMSKTAKIKNIVDTFIKKIESAHTFETAREQISQNEAQKKSIVERIEAIESKLASGEEAKSFREQIEKLNYDREISNLADEVIAGAQKKITNYLGGSDKKDFKTTSRKCFVKYFRGLLIIFRLKFKFDLKICFKKCSRKCNRTFRGV